MSKIALGSGWMVPIPICAQRISVKQEYRIKTIGNDFPTDKELGVKNIIKMTVVRES
jgi:hypothetical protein